ncbi:YmiA family putative membrane protein [Erwinia sp. CPCC 100877]|nr:YmiA family putative membrane protein [Erwinia sp. CPCC 100877]
MSSQGDDLQREPGLKRKAWLAAFLVSALFWVGLLLLVWKFWG